LTTYVSEDVAWSAANALRFDLTRHCLKLDPSFFKRYTSGELIERIDGDVNALSNFFSQMVIHILGNLLLLAGVLILLFWEDWRIGLALLVFALAALFILIRIRTLAIPYWVQVREMSATFFGFLSELLGATEDIQANGARSYAMFRFHQLARAWLPIQVRAGVMGSALRMTAVAVFALGTVTAFVAGGLLWRRGAITLGTVYLIFYYTELLRQPIEQIRHQFEDLQQAEGSLIRIEELRAKRSRLVEGAGAELPAGPLALEFRDVSFGYEEPETVLRNISFRLEPGQVLGLLGRTGSGKTTLARLALRLYDPSQGEVRLGEVALPDLKLATLRRHIGMVTQEVQLFQASVRDNLTFFNPAISDEQLRSVLADLELTSWLNDLPDGLDTILQAEGSNLSAGQAQLLAFGRVFLTDPGLIVLDEASSRLDPATERRIERAIDKLLYGPRRTGIIIAHRLPTLQRVDQILVLKEGRILEYGSRAQLAAEPHSHFSQLLQTGLTVEEAAEVSLR
jgi:ABC-type multidrug transport system fused ATPase/permease subunit